ncbi:hypothetical protein LXJ56_26460, partial [Escherichia coli]|nr:hypothetical protein [Escherichia coli]
AFKASVIEWNERLLSLDLSVRTRFRDASLSQFEWLQARLAEATRKLNAFIASDSRTGQAAILRELREVRAEFFNFTQNMVREARLLHRQMHFGVVV